MTKELGMAGNTCEPQREQKHIVTDRSLMALGMAIRDIEDVIDRIKGEDSPPEAMGDKGDREKSLLEFMDTTTEVVEKLRERVLGITNQLNQTIF